ncbi:MAG: iron-only hydrogenase system regulator [Clostridia bacterium]|nr:iron-only hydrogenase system regulator [Clostridia bacterium]
METRLSVISIILHGRESAGQVNAILSEYGDYIIGRMGLPYREKGMHVMSIVIDAPGDAINSLTGKLGRINDVSVKALFAKT